MDNGRVEARPYTRQQPLIHPYTAAKLQYTVAPAALYTASRWPAWFRQKAMGGFGGGFCNVLIVMASCFLLLLQGVGRKW